MELSSSNISNFFIFSSREKFSYISGNKNPDKISYIFSNESFSYNSGNENPEKIPYILGNGTLYSRKWKP